MTSILFTLLIVTMLAVLGVLMAGLVGMARGDAFNRKYGNKLMQARVFLQGLAIVLFALVVMSQGAGS